MYYKKINIFDEICIFKKEKLKWFILSNISISISFLILYYSFQYYKKNFYKTIFILKLIINLYIY